jgi:hypothetical protein
MRRCIPVIIFFLVFGGQLFAQEIQVPIGKVYDITEEMEAELHLFQAYPHFHQARLFLIKKDSIYTLEITTLDSGKLVTTRLPQTKADVLELERRYKEAAHGDQAPGIFVYHNSQSKLPIWETLISAFAYGPMVIKGTNTTNTSLELSLELVVGGLGYIIPNILTRNSIIQDGETSLALGGAFLGMGHGALLDVVLHNKATGNEIYLYSAVGSIVETAAGYFIGRSANISEGSADMLRYTGLFGGFQGWGLAYLIDNRPSPQLKAGVSLLGSVGGFAVGNSLLKSENFSRGNASVVLTSGGYGSFFLPLLYSSFTRSVKEMLQFNENTSLRPRIAAYMLSNIASIIVANSLMRSRHFTTGEGNDVIVGTTGGFLIGYGLGAILSPGALSSNSNLTVDKELEFSLPIILSTSIAFALMMKSMGEGKGVEENSKTGWNMNIDPSGLMGALLTKTHTASQSKYISPALSLEYKW